MLLSTAWGDISQQSRNHSRLRRLCLVRRGSHSSSLPSSVQVPPSAATSSVADPTLNALVPHPSLLIRAPSQEAPQAAPLVLHDHGTMAGPFSTSLSHSPSIYPLREVGPAISQYLYPCAERVRVCLRAPPWRQPPWRGDRPCWRSGSWSSPRPPLPLRRHSIASRAACATASAGSSSRAARRHSSRSTPVAQSCWRCRSASPRPGRSARASAARPPSRGRCVRD